MKFCKKLHLAAFVVFTIFSCTHQKKSVGDSLLTSIHLKISSKALPLEQIKKITPEIEISYKGESSQEIFSAIGFALIPVLNSIYGETWKSFEGVLFTALDGYKIDIPTTRILKYNPILAYRYKNPQTPFNYNSKGNEGIIELGPYYLVWDNITYPELIKDGGYGWPYQIAEIEPIRYASYYSNVFPFKKATPLIREGFEAYKKNCMACHALKDQGGQKGPQLWPYPPLQRFGREKFTQWVLSPQKLAPQTTMPALNPELSLKERKKLASKIYLYLAALHKSKN